MLKKVENKRNRILALLLSAVLLAVGLMPTAAFAESMAMRDGSDENIEAVYTGQSEDVSFYAKAIEGDGQISAAKASLEGEYEPQVLAWDFALYEGETERTAWESGESVSATLPLNVEVADEPGAYTEGYFAGDFDGYAGAWDTRYTELYYIADDGTVTKMGSGGDILGVSEGEAYINPALSSSNGVSAPSGKLMLVQRSLPKLESPLAPGVYHVPVDLWKFSANAKSEMFPLVL
mgnify:FL=1